LISIAFQLLDINYAFLFHSTAVASASTSASASASAATKRKNSISSLIEQIFHTINRNNSGGISIEDAEKALLRLNSRLGRRYGEDDVIAFFSALDKNQDGTLDFEEFKSAFENIVI
jgi:Ca2+-binding EF-hand superfamily protein